MAASKKKRKTATKKPQTKSARNTAKKPEPNPQTKRVWEILLFAFGLLLLCLTWVRGESLWLILHNGLFGLFGWVAYLLSPILIAVAVLVSTGRQIGGFYHKIWQSALFFVLLCAQVQILQIGEVPAVSVLFGDGVERHGGGVIGGLVAWLFLKTCGRVGAAILVFLILFVLFMLVGGFTILGMLRGMSRPVQLVREEHQERLKQQEQGQKRKFNVDVPLGPDYPKPAEDKPAPAAKPAPKADVKDIVRRAVEEPTAQKEEKAVSADMPVPEAAGQKAYQFPSLELLNHAKSVSDADASREMEQSAKKLIETLRSFGVETTLTGIERGPSVTRYEIQPSVGVKLNKITNLADDIALNMAASGVRIAPIPNKTSIGVEIPNQNTSIVAIREILGSTVFQNAKSKLTMALGKDVAGKIMVADVAKMPHVLIAGATGSGKSVCINSLLMSILFHATPDEVRLILVDPKMVELGVYNGIPHLLVPVVTDPRKAAGALNWAVTEMLKRYKLLSDNGVQNLETYSKLAETSDTLEKLPQIVIVIDELSDLMMVASAEVQDSINRLAAMARAAGMHLVVATQRPSTNVITGVIKANIPSRIALSVSSQIDSRIILDEGGAEKLLGRGDMLFYLPSMSKPRRVQGCYVDEEEIARVIDFVKKQAEADYDTEVLVEIDRQSAKGEESGGEGGLSDEDDMLPAAIEFVVEAGQASTSALQRRLKLGYARAGRLMDIMEQKGIVGPFEGSKPRKVLMTKQQWIEMRLRQPDVGNGQISLVEDSDDEA